MFTPFFVLTKFIKQILPENNRRNTLRNFFVNLVSFLWDEYNITCQQEKQAAITFTFVFANKLTLDR